MFSGCTVPPDSKETELRSSNQEASPSAGKNTGDSFSAKSRMEVCVSLQLFIVVWIFPRFLGDICSDSYDY